MQLAIGATAAMSLYLRNATLSSAEALRLGLVGEVCTGILTTQQRAASLACVLVERRHVAQVGLSSVLEHFLRRGQQHSER